MLDDDDELDTSLDKSHDTRSNVLTIRCQFEGNSSIMTDNVLFQENFDDTSTLNVIVLPEV
jgi:hypothetical protein